MKKVLITTLIVVVVAVAGFFAYMKFKPLPPAQNQSTEVAELAIPEGFRPVGTEDYDYNYGGKFYEWNYDGYGERAGVMFRFDVNENSDENQLDGQLSNTLIHDLQEIRMSETEYHAESPDSIDFLGQKALRYYYTLKDEPYDETAKKKDPRSAYKKGEAIAFFCSGKTVILYFETFEKHWDKNQDTWNAIKSGIKLKCN